MNSVATSQSSVQSQFIVPIRTSYLFVLLSLASLVLAWASNEMLFTRETLAAMAGTAANSYQVDLQYESLRQHAWIGYIVSPIQTAIRIVFTALLLQLICLLTGVEARFFALFRVAAFGFIILLLGSILQLIWISQVPGAIEQASLGIVPDSVAAWVKSVADLPIGLRLSLNRISVTALLWILLLIYGLRRAVQMRLSTATVVTCTTWFIVNLLNVLAAALASEQVT